MNPVSLSTSEPYKAQNKSDGYHNGILPKFKVCYGILYFSQKILMRSMVRRINLLLILNCC